MAKLFNMKDDEVKANFLDKLRREIQSANINFIIGSGCTAPAIPLLGNIENDIEKKIGEGKDDEAEELIFGYLEPFLEVTDKLKSNTDAVVNTVLDNYKSFLGNITQILFERKSNILPKRATIFSTNYDLFIERAFEEVDTHVNLSDGFKRNPSISRSFKFSSSEFFNSIYNSGNLYSYNVEIPSINLVKLHGSLSWQTNDKDIVFSVDHLGELLAEHKKLSRKKKTEEIKKFNNKFSVVFPKKEKFKNTVLNQTYYDLLRLYANELDKENTLLIVDGFSFADEHLLEITKRALKNPTLIIIIFSYTKEASECFSRAFSSYNNVDIVYAEGENISFVEFNSIIKEVVPLAHKPNVGNNQAGATK